MLTCHSLIILNLKKINQKEQNLSLFSSHPPYPTQNTLLFHPNLFSFFSLFLTLRHSNLFIFFSLSFSLTNNTRTKSLQLHLSLSHSKIKIYFYFCFWFYLVSEWKCYVKFIFYPDFIFFFSFLNQTVHLFTKISVFFSFLNQIVHLLIIFSPRSQFFSAFSSK